MARPSIFPTIRTEGGLLPTDLLSQVAAGSLPGMSPEIDYHLAPHERLNEAVSRSWNRLLAAWANFNIARAKLASGDLATTETREKWLLPLFTELGYGRLAATRAVELNGRSYPISHDWGVVPIHLVGAGVDLDQRAHGVVGAARMSPHGLVQELLNGSTERLWGVVSNGLQLRLLRDSAAITRQAFFEIDLEEMMDGEVYSDFVVLWLVAHQSRLEGERPETCWLERWSLHATEQGTRALDRLREGVEVAITSLGRGFLIHSANGRLRDSLRAGSLDRQGFYRQLLRLVYRLIFLMVAEDRDLLHPPGTDPAARTTYADHYSVGRLRRLAEWRRGSSHSDLYEALTLVMNSLGQEGGLPQLGMPALGSFLWRAEAITDLASCHLRNRDLLEAITALAFTTEGRVRRGVDYRNLGSEELGSVYESLLELHPELNLEAPTFSLGTAGGHERKVTGSYYTPTSLIANLLDTALDPVLAEAVSASDPEAAILNLKVVDPACGSGHFLIAAAHRIAKRLASVRTGDAEAAPEAVRHALRDVIGRCIHGVDMNDMAVELCKVSLWMEALQPGRPLSFLDNHIILGNSLLGATPILLQSGIPDDAFKPIEGDDPEVVRSWKRRNREEIAGQTVLALEGELAATELASKHAAELDALPDEDISGVIEKENRYRKLIASNELERARLAADAWCAAFVAPKIRGAPEITEGVRHRLATNPGPASSGAESVVRSLTAIYHFMHWHLAFPGVFRVPPDSEVADNRTTGWSGGFDLVLGNPPWGQVELKEQEWFADRDGEIAQLPGAKRKLRITQLANERPELHAAYVAAAREAADVSHLLRDSGRFPLCGHGRINTYSVFAESMRSLLGPTGRAGIIVPTGIATDDTTKEFFADLVESQSLASLYDFENAAPLFPGVHRSYKFCLLTLSGRERPVIEGAEFAFFAHAVPDLADPDRRFRLTADDLRLLNPNTRTCPIFRTRRDAQIAKTVYQRVPVLVNDSRPDGNPWGITFRQGLFNMASDSGLFRTRSDLESDGWTLIGNVFAREGTRYLPLYEAKMFHIYNDAWANGDDTAVPTAGIAVPRYWVLASEVDKRLEGWKHPWLFAWRNIARTTDERTVIATVLPRVGVGHSASVGLIADELVDLLPVLAAIFSSLAFDFIARYKVGGVNLSFFMVEQMPVLPPSELAKPTPWDPTISFADWVRSRAKPLFRVLNADTARMTNSDDGRIDILRSEIDAGMFRMYGLDRETTSYALETFSVLRDREVRQYGSFRTHHQVLEAYDTLANLQLASSPGG